jgi:hypothetical protein
MGRKIAFWLLVVLLSPSMTQAACTLDSKATIPLRFSGGAITVALEVNGQAATFVLDTGASRSAVTPEAAQRLGLARDQWAGTTMSGIGGIGIVERPPNANPRSMSIGGVPLARRRLSHDSSLAVIVLSNRPYVDGLLGGDFLSVFDLDLDIPHARLTLYQTKDCAGRFLPWSGDYTAIPSMITVENAIYVQPLIDGKPLRAIFDTGATSSMLAAPGMFKLGLDQANLTADPSHQIGGVGRRQVVAHRHAFKSLQLGNQVIEQPSIWVEPIRLPRIVDMILGLDWIGRREIWISYTTKQLFVAAP